MSIWEAEAGEGGLLTGESSSDEIYAILYFCTILLRALSDFRR